MEFHFAFTVVGQPAPAGSKQAFPSRRKDGTLGVCVVHDCVRTKPWMATVANAAHEAYCGELLSGPVRLAIVFCRPRLKGHLSAKGGVKASAPKYPTTKPDLTKLVRAIEDALTGVVWRDDAQVVEQAVCKSYGDGYVTRIEVTELSNEIVPHLTAPAGHIRGLDLPPIPGRAR